MKRCLSLFLSLTLCIFLIVPALAVEIPLTSHAALLMEKETGEILFAENEHEALPPASVTKIMTMLLVMEAIDDGAISTEDVVTVSAHAASMGGSQVFLSEGEQITVDDLLKALCVASGNDASVALAEHVSGVTELFVEEMNSRARALGMLDTHFVNCTGLTAEGHLTSAYDIALMSRELLLHHPEIRNYTTIWMDTLRGGTFGLSNTNKLIRFYDGATGLKTGYTDTPSPRTAANRASSSPETTPQWSGRRAYPLYWGRCRTGGSGRYWGHRPYKKVSDCPARNWRACPVSHLLNRR